MNRAHQSRAGSDPDARALSTRPPGLGAGWGKGGLCVLSPRARSVSLSLSLGGDHAGSLTRGRPLGIPWSAWFLKPGVILRRGKSIRKRRKQELKLCREVSQLDIISFTKTRKGDTSFILC